MLADGAVDGVAARRTAACARSASRHRGAAAALRFEAALARELRRGLRRGASSRTCARSTPCSPLRSCGRCGVPRRPLVHALAREPPAATAARLLDARSRASTTRSFPLPSRKLVAIGHGIDLDEFPCSPPRARRHARCSRSAATRTAKGLDVVVARGRARRRRRRAARPRPVALGRGARATAASSSSSSRARARRRASTIGDAVPRARVPGLLATHDALVNNMRAGAPRQGRLRGGGRLPAGARLEPALRRAPRAGAALRRAGPGRARRADPRARGADRESARSAARSASASRASTRCESWARRHPRRGGSRMTDGVVLHSQKVAGISGSEAHLLLAAARRCASAAGTSASSCSTRTSPARGSSPTRSRARGVPLDDIRLRATSTRVAFGAARRLPRAPAPADPAHAPRPRRRLRPARRLGSRASRVRALDEARLQRVPRGALVRLRRPLGRLARARAHRDLARSRAVPRARREGFDEERLRDRPLRDRSRAATRRRTPERAAPALRRPADPDQGPRSSCCARWRRRGARARRDARHRRPRPARAGAARRTRASSGSRTRSASSASSRRCRRRSRTPRSSSCPRSARASAWSRSRRWSAARPGDRERRRRPSRDRRRRRDRPRRARRPTPRRSRTRSSSSRATCPRAAAMGAAGRDRALAEFTPERCVERHRGALRARARAGAA